MAELECDDFKLAKVTVIASQRVRPEVAGPMTGSAKQSRTALQRWIASSLRSSQ
jgi:ribosomal protein S17E